MGGQCATTVMRCVEAPRRHGKSDLKVNKEEIIQNTRFFFLPLAYRHRYAAGGTPAVLATTAHAI
jgi:hypothetical protein